MYITYYDSLLRYCQNFEVKMKIKKNPIILWHRNISYSSVSPSPHSPSTLSHSPSTLPLLTTHPSNPPPHSPPTLPPTHHPPSLHSPHTLPLHPPPPQMTIESWLFLQLQLHMCSFPTCFFLLQLIIVIIHELSCSCSLCFTVTSRCLP